MNTHDDLLKFLKENVNQKQLSNIINISQSNISRSLNSSCSLRNFVKICEGANIEIKLIKK